MAENGFQGQLSTRTKIQPTRLKLMSDNNNGTKKDEQPLTVRKRLEPMRIKDLIKTLSARKKPDPSRTPFPSKSAERVNVPRQSTITPAVHGKNVRRKLYSTQNTPHDLKLQTRLCPSSKLEQPKSIGDVNRNRTARKSFLLPPNSIKEYYVRKTQNKESVSEASHKDASVQTSDEPVNEISSTKPTLTQNPESLPPLQSTEKVLTKNSEIVFNARTANIESEKQVSTNLIDPSCVPHTTENGIVESENNQSDFARSIVSQSGYNFFPQSFLGNQVFVQVPLTMENPRIAQSVPIVNSTSELGPINVIDERNNLLLIESYLKEGIVNMTQTLNLVQNTLYSKLFISQAQSTVPLENENNVHQPPTTVAQNFHSPMSETFEFRDIKIEPIYGDTSPPTVVSLTPATSDVEINNEVRTEVSREPTQLKSLRIRLENCLLKSTNESAHKKNEVPVLETQKSNSQETYSRSQKEVENPTKKSSKENESQSIRPKTPRIDSDLLRTPKIHSKTPKTIDRHLLMTPRRIDNKENFQTPMSRRKTFSGLDSQNLRRSVRIARHNLRQSLGDDSFLALERELNICYPQSNI